MARRRRRKSRDDDYPGWIWMMFGLSIGLAVAFAIYINDRTPGVPIRPVAEQPTNVDDNKESAGTELEEPPEARFDFYNLLPKFEVVIPEQERDVRVETSPQAVVEPGVYVLQAGSFSAFEDADRRRATLALLGIESKIQRVTIDDKTYHRVRIGPIDDLDQLNVLRSRLREAEIDVLRIRLGD
jgi:cell division protein FtsN